MYFPSNPKYAGTYNQAGLFHIVSVMIYCDKNILILHDGNIYIPCWYVTWDPDCNRNKYDKWQVNYKCKDIFQHIFLDT